MGHIWPASFSCTTSGLWIVFTFYYGLKKNDKNSMWLTVFKIFTGPLQEKCFPLQVIKAGVEPTWDWRAQKGTVLGEPSFSLMVGLWSSRTNSSERPGNQGPKTEDSWSHGRHAQHNIQCCHQPPEPRFPPLLFQICGDQPLWTRSQCLCLPAPEEMKASSVFRSAIWLSEGVKKERLWQSRLKKKVDILWDCICCRF